MPTYGPSEFKSVDPGSGQILIHFTGSGTSTDDTASQCNVSIEDCFGNNRTADIVNLTKITISNTAGDDIDLNVINGTAYSTHYNFDIDPDVYFPSESITVNSCLDTTFDPSPFLDFSNNQYNATLNNTEKDRTSQYIFNIDSQRSGSTSRPLNYQQIIDGTAVTASVQDSFYTDSGIINGRFDGTETTKAQYGISPALAGNSFQGILFPSDTEDVQIASSSKDSNLYKDFIFTLDKHFTYAANQPRSLVTISGSINTLTPNARYLHVNDDSFNVRAQILGTANTGYIHISGSALGTHHHALADQKGRLFSNFDSFTSGEPFLIKNGGSDWEFIQSNGTFATDFGTVSGSVTHPFTQIFIQTGSRKYPSYDKDKGPFVSYNNRNNTNTHRINNTTSVFGDSWQIYKLIGDSIFEADGNQIGLVTDKKLLVVDTGDILYIDSRGQAIWNIGNVNLI